jgi:G3E family GTPase
VEIDPALMESDDEMDECNDDNCTEDHDHAHHEHGHGHGHGHADGKEDEGKHDHGGDKEGHEHGHEHGHGHGHGHADGKEDEGKHDHGGDKEGHEHGHGHGHSGGAADEGPQKKQKKKRVKKKHDLSNVSSVGMKFKGNFDVPKFNMFMSTLLQAKAADMYRSKGILSFEGQGNTKFVFQGVHETINFGPAAKPWADDEPRESKIVFIGRGLNRDELREGLEKCMA